MGLKFEAIVLASSFQEVHLALSTISSPIGLDLKEVDAGFSVALRVDEDYNRLHEEVDRAAAVLSQHLGRALVVRWNSTVGYHAATLFIDGKLSRSFGEDDDSWVPCGDDGELALDQGRFKLSELDPKVEYDVLKGAVDFGLEALGRGTQYELTDAIAEWY
jgi:hypothetical protein